MNTDRTPGHPGAGVNRVMGGTVADA